MKKETDGFFYEKPQERKGFADIIEFVQDGKSHKESEVFSIPCERCENCPVYRIDETVTPTAYYCQAGSLFGVLRKALEEKTIPPNCRVVEVRGTKNYP